MFVAACSPQEQRYVGRTGTASFGPSVFRADDGATLPVSIWQAAEPRALVLALHGFNDYRHAFEGLGTFLAANHITLVAYDQRGFGATREHGIWPGEDNLTRDADTAVRRLVAQNPGIPVYLFGESMGGSVAVETLARDPSLPVRGVILSAPALWRVGPFYRSGLWLGAHTIPATTVTGQGLHILASDNLEMLRALGRDPLIIKATRIDAIYGLVGLMADAAEDAPKVKTPLLLLYGAHDQIVPKKAAEEAISHSGASVRVGYYDQGYHMLERDLEGGAVDQDIAGWILDDTAPLTSGADRNWQERMNEEEPDALPPNENRFRRPWYRRPAVTSK